MTNQSQPLALTFAHEALRESGRKIMRRDVVEPLQATIGKVLKRFGKDARLVRDGQPGKPYAVMTNLRGLLARSSDPIRVWEEAAVAGTQRWKGGR